MDFDKWQLESVAEEMTEPLRSGLKNLSRRLEALESLAQSPTTRDPETLSVPTTGPANKPSRSGTVSHREIGAPILWAIMAGSKSTKSILPELVEFWEDCTTLQLTLRWPMPSTETMEVGGRGPASPDYVEHSVEADAPSPSSEPNNDMTVYYDAGFKAGRVQGRFDVTQKWAEEPSP